MNKPPRNNTGIKAFRRTENQNDRPNQNPSSLDLWSKPAGRNVQESPGTLFVPSFCLSNERVGLERVLFLIMRRTSSAIGDASYNNIKKHFSK